MTLRSATIRLAHANPSLRPHILPILREAGYPYGLTSKGKYPEPKDVKRIQDMVDKAQDFQHLVQLATNMAKAITSVDKAWRRSEAATDAGQHEVAKIFADRAYELGR